MYNRNIPNYVYSWQNVQNLKKCTVATRAPVGAYNLSKLQSLKLEGTSHWFCHFRSPSFETEDAGLLRSLCAARSFDKHQGGSGSFLRVVEKGRGWGKRRRQVANCGRTLPGDQLGAGERRWSQFLIHRGRGGWWTVERLPRSGFASSCFFCTHLRSRYCLVTGGNGSHCQRQEERWQRRPH